MLLLSNRAEVQLQQQQFERAATDCRAALQLDPQHAKSYSRLARAQEGMSSPPRAGGTEQISIDEMSVRQLKEVITRAGLSLADCCEKRDLQARAREAMQ